MQITTLKNPELLSVIDKSGKRFVGGDQHWYPKEGYIPMGACGATTASNILGYLLRSRPELYKAAEGAGLRGLAAPDAPVNEKDYYLEFMKLVYTHMHPRAGGLMADLFVSGFAELAADYNLPVSTERLKISIVRSKRPSAAEVCAFIAESLNNDIPVAFLILSGGGAKTLDTWHWVTIVGVDESKKQITITDNGAVHEADIDLWLNTSIMGGSFVRLQINARR